MTRTASTASQTDCPKCGGGAKLPQFKHVQGGTCFLCDGAGQVTEAQASRWLARQVTRDLPRRAPGRAVQSGPRIPRKEITLRGFSWSPRDYADVYGPTLVVDPDGSVTCDVSMPKPGRFSGRFGDLPFGFTVDGGRVRIDYVCNGLRGMERHLTRALQAAYRG